MFGGTIALLGALLVLTESCGSKSGSSSSSAGTLIPIPGTINQAGASLALADEELNLATSSTGTSTSVTTSTGTTATVLLTGCSSGRRLTCSSNDIEVYYGDLNCVIQLQTFTTNGTTYNATSACSSITWKSGTQCAFANAANSTQQINVTVIQQLSSPTVTTDQVIFEWAQVEVGQTQLFTSQTLGFDAPVSTIVQPAPQFYISSLLYYGINPNGSGNFGFTLLCGNPVTSAPITETTSSTNSALPVCSGAPLSQLDYALVAYPTTAVTSTTNTSVLAALIAASTDYTINWSGTTNQKITNGFQTSEMPGIGLISTSTPMLLLLRWTTTQGTATVQSYTAYQIQLATLPGCQAAANGGTCLDLE